MRLTGMDIRDTPPFTELVKLDFDARVNLFIGPNASGKSTLLEQIYIALNKNTRPESQHYVLMNVYYLMTDNGLEETFVLSTKVEEAMIDAVENADLSYESFWETLGTAQIFTLQEEQPGLRAIDSPVAPVVYVGAVRSGLPELHENATLSEDDMDLEWALREPFSGADFKVINDAIRQKAKSMLEGEKQKDLPSDMSLDELRHRAHRISEAVDTAYSCVKAICSEVLTGKNQQNYVAGSIDELYHQPLASSDEVNIHRGLGVNTLDQPNFNAFKPEYRPSYFKNIGQTPLYAGFLSSGTQSTFLWIHWLAYRMLHHYEFAEDWINQPAILLIDEIENHLHPTWQRRVIPALLEHFPGLQIFATTHSPFVVAGLRAGQVHLLDRNSDGVVTATTTEQDIIGWTTDEILRSFMGVSQPTDELTIRRSNRLRELRRKDSLSDDEREELETLRRQVNADILSSRSSLELQDERYADMMMRFIESRQNELSQDDR